MFNTIWGLIPTKYKVIAGIAIAIIVFAIGGIISYQSYKIDNYKKELTICKTRLEYEKAIYKSEMDKSKNMIEAQNESINDFKIKNNLYENTIKQKEIELLEKEFSNQKEIESMLQKDSSCDNQLEIISKMMKDFSNEIR